MTEEQIRHTFKYHSPDEATTAAHELTRLYITETAVNVAELLPPSRERSLFITLMQQAQMMANAAIAIHGLPKEGDSANIGAP